MFKEGDHVTVYGHYSAVIVEMGRGLKSRYFLCNNQSNGYRFSVRANNIDFIEVEIIRE